MAIQLIFCLEANKTAQTDWAYIKEFLNEYYTIDNSVKLTPKFMGSKSRYNSNDIQNYIKKTASAYMHGETKVIYCIDTDDFEKNQNHKRELDDIQKYCKVNGYDCVWFCHDVEEVFLGERVQASEKTNKASNFKKTNAVKKMKLALLSSKVMGKGKSNLMVVLDKYLRRK